MKQIFTAACPKKTFPLEMEIDQEKFEVNLKRALPLLLPPELGDRAADLPSQTAALPPTHHCFLAQSCFTFKHAGPTYPKHVATDAHLVTDAFAHNNFLYDAFAMADLLSNESCSH
jgi:hypothetical protein